MNGRDFFELAVQLYDGESASELRSCVSRAYYGAFHVAREFVDAECRVNLPADAACHTKLHQLLESSGNDILANIGRRLGSLRNARNSADYRLDHAPSNTKKNAMLHLEIAREIIDRVQNGLEPSSRTTAIDEIRNKASAVFRFIVRS